MQENTLQHSGVSLRNTASHDRNSVYQRGGFRVGAPEEGGLCEGCRIPKVLSKEDPRTHPNITQPGPKVENTSLMSDGLVVRSSLTALAV